MDIEIRNLSVTFMNDEREQVVLKKACLFLPQGKVTAIVGESGSGKSILGTAVAGLLDQQAVISGQILYGETDIVTLTGPELEQLRGRRISWLAQNPVSAMDPLQRTGAFVTEILKFRKGYSSEQLRETGVKQLARFGLANAEAVYRSYPGVLSGGMAQRALLGAMTVEEPEWLIADEPTKGLDAMARRQVYLNLQQLARERKMGMILITHDLRLAEKLSDFTAVMYAGEIVEYAKTDVFFGNPCHPYSQGLINAQPEKAMQPIPGEAPEFTELIEGCAFASRCTYYCEACRSKQEMRGTGSRSVRCWRYGQADGDSTCS